MPTPACDFYHMITVNKMLSDKLDFLHSHFFPNHVTDSESFNNTIYKTMFDNVYTISEALHERGQSFILPLPMFKQLLDMKERFQTAEDALQYVDNYRPN